MEIRVHEGLADIAPERWDAMAGANDPFAEHAFLSTLEASGSVGDESGWHPLHLVLYEDESSDAPIGALPLYLKEHSYGEYIFDWGWAGGAQQAGIRYYPKLVSMAPVTPATGRRFLVHPDADRASVVSALLEGALATTEATGASSLHLLFLNDEERAEVAADERFMMRLSMQYHWHSAGDATFDAYLGRFRSSARKNVRKERRRVRQSGLRVETRTGAELSAEDWQTLRRFYQDTCFKKGGYPYLTDAFFELAPEALRDTALATMAFDGERCVAGTLNFEKGAHLYGRYWGCAEDFDMLHFELCYYQLLERAIARGMTRFEAGAQGRQKLKRGLMPSKVHSAHFIANPGLRRAVGEFIAREAFEVSRRIEIEGSHGPFKSEDQGS